MPAKRRKQELPDQHLLHQGIAQREPLLHEMNPQHHLQQKRRFLSLGLRSKSIAP